MYHCKHYGHDKFFEKNPFGGCKSQIFVFGYWIAERGDRAGYP